MITAASLKAYRAKDLAQMAKRRGVPGWHSMRKDQLIRALVRAESRNGDLTNKRNGRGKRSHSTARVSAAVSTKHNGAEAPAYPTPRNPQTTRKSRQATRRIQQAQARREHFRDLSGPSNGQPDRLIEHRKDRIVLMVRDPYWLHVYWELTSRAISRAQAAMAEQWHTAKPVLRLLHVDNGTTTNTTETVVRSIEIHGGVRNWYIDVSDPPQGYRVEVGYLAATGKFYPLARSNAVTTPRPSGSDDVDHNWADVADNCEKIFALSGGYSQDNGTGDLQEILEERLRRPLGSPMVTRFGIGAESSLHRERRFAFQLDAEMIVFGATQPDAHVTLGGEPVKLREDGTFTVRVSMPEGRQVLPAVSSSVDGMEQQTIVLAVERNTKTMEPLVRDAGC